MDFEALENEMNDFLEEELANIPVEEKLLNLAGNLAVVKQEVVYLRLALKSLALTMLEFDCVKERLGDMFKGFGEE